MKKAYDISSRTAFIAYTITKNNKPSEKITINFRTKIAIVSDHQLRA
jgi:hypothetical protein